jgi:uncharacterized protein YfiM (DUF2279 family)
VSALLLALALPLAGCPVTACAVSPGAPRPLVPAEGVVEAPLRRVAPGASPAAAGLRPVPLPPALLPVPALPPLRLGPPPVPRAAGPARRRGEDSAVGEDKFKHFFMSFVITTVGYGVARIAMGHDPAVFTAIAVGALAGIGKEVYDARTGGDASVGDLAWDGLGIGVGTALNTQIR